MWLHCNQVLTDVLLLHAEAVDLQFREQKTLVTCILCEKVQLPNSWQIIGNPARTRIFSLPRGRHTVSPEHIEHGRGRCTVACNRQNHLIVGQVCISFVARCTEWHPRHPAFKCWLWVCVLHRPQNSNSIASKLTSRHPRSSACPKEHHVYPMSCIQNKQTGPKAKFSTGFIVLWRNPFRSLTRILLGRAAVLQ